MKKILILTSLTIFSIGSISSLWSQGPNNNPITLIANAPPAVNTPSVQIVGNQGSATYVYWVVANYPVGSASPSGGGIVINAPSTLTGSNYVRVSWNTIPGVLSYDLLRTTSLANIPSGNCNCAVATGLASTATPYSNTSNSLSSYTVNSVGSVKANITLLNRNHTTPRIDIDTPLNLPYIGYFGIGTTLNPLPVASKAYRIAIVNNGSTASDCTVGGGTSFVLCMDTGSVWTAIGGSGTGGGPYVPYTGATNDVNLGNHNLTILGNVMFGPAVTVQSYLEAQVAINTACSLGGGSIHIVGGTYIATATGFVFPTGCTNVEVFGDGAATVFSVDGNLHFISPNPTEMAGAGLFQGIGVQNIYLHDLKINGPNTILDGTDPTNGTQRAVSFSSKTSGVQLLNLRVERIIVNGLQSENLYAQAGIGTPPTQIYFNSNILTYCRFEGIALNYHASSILLPTSGVDHIMYGNYINHVGAYGIESPADYTLIDSNIILDSKVYAISIISGGTDNSNTSVTHNLIRGMNDVISYGIYLAGRGVSVAFNDISGMGGSGIFIGDFTGTEGQDNIITHNILHNNGTIGIYNAELVFRPISTHNIVSENICYKEGTTATCIITDGVSNLFVNNSVSGGYTNKYVDSGASVDIRIVDTDYKSPFVQHNALTYSQDFDNAAWTKGNSTITAASILAPDSALTGQSLAGNSTNNRHNVQQPSSTSGQVTFSIYALVGTAKRLLLRESTSTGAAVSFDLSTGVIVGTESGGTGTILTLGNSGWYRLSLTINPGASLVSHIWAIYMLPDNGTSFADTTYNTGTALYLWGSQLNAGAVPGPYARTVVSATL